ncbi:MAG: ABC transporter ATP-binding protein [Rhodospirillales bacterium]|nr:ABC transporter ATP-binding protein [Rhodospirillales bacterium]
MIKHGPDRDSAPLSAEKLHAAFRNKAVLHDISVEIPKNRLTVLVGPNGSGKSTLLSAMSRLIPPAGGTVYLDSKDIHTRHTRDIARKLGILPQTPILPENLTVHDLVSRGRYPHQGLFKQWTKADEDAVRNAMEITNTAAFANRPVQNLSGGQRQRCFIAMALAQETDIILLDEPTTYLDLRYQVEVMKLIADLCQNHGRTIVAVLHDLNFALQYADYMIFLKDGKIYQTIDDPRSCSADLISDVFATDVVRLIEPQSGIPVFMPLHAKHTDASCTTGAAL